MADDDLDLFLALAAEEPAETAQTADGAARSGQPSSADCKDDDLDLFLKLADEYDAPSAAAQDVALRQSVQAEEPQTLVKRHVELMQPRLSGHTLSGTCAKPAVVPGAIPSCKPLAQQLPIFTQRQQHGAFQVIGATQQSQQPQQQRSLGRPGVFRDTEQGSVIQRLSGLKIKNPVVSSAMVKARLSDSSVVKLGQLRARHRSTGLEGSWATICVIGEKSKPRESQSGRPYSIWKVTDLDQTSHSLFLFGEAHSDLYKESVGTLVALFSPKVKSDGDFSLSIDSPDQLWVLGTAPEFGFCKAIKKRLWLQNGDPCRIPVNAMRCPFCPYHIQSEYNRLKPTRRNEFQETNLKTAFRPGMQRAGAQQGLVAQCLQACSKDGLSTAGLQWQVGQFAGDGPRAVPPRMPVLPAERLESTAENARGKGSSTGARYLKTVANPGAAAAACQEREVLALRRNRIGPGEAPIPLPRPSNVVLQAAPAGGTAHRRGAGGVLVTRSGKRKPGEQEGQGGAAHAGALPAKRRTQPGGGGAQSSGGGAGEAVLLECDLFEDDARRRAIELLKSVGGAPAPDPNSSRRVPASGGGGPSPQPAPSGAAALRPEREESGTEEASAGSGTLRSRQSRQSGTPGAGPSIKASPLDQVAPPVSAASTSPAELTPCPTSARRGPTPPQHRGQQQEGQKADRDTTLPAARAVLTPQDPNVQQQGPAAATSAAARVASRGYLPAEPGQSAPAGKGAKQQGSGCSRSSIMGKLGIKPSGGGGSSKGGGLAGGGKGSSQGAPAAAAKSAFEAAFGSVIREMEATAGAQTTSRYESTVDEEDHDRIHNMLSVLEKKDEMAQKMDSVKSLTVTAFRCKQCSYTSEKRRPECGEHPHMVERVQVAKRWWECEHCKYRFASVGVRYPAKRCSKCQHPQADFKAVSMYRPAKQYEHETSAVASRDNLMARGLEQKWVMS